MQAKGFGFGIWVRLNLCYYQKTEVRDPGLAICSWPWLQIDQDMPRHLLCGFFEKGTHLLETDTIHIMHLTHPRAQAKPFIVIFERAFWTMLIMHVSF